jgi:hypothetical protein
MDIAVFSGIEGGVSRNELGQRLLPSVEYSNHFARCAAGGNPERTRKYVLRNEHWQPLQSHACLRESPYQALIKIN